MATQLEHYLMVDFWDQHGDPRIRNYPLMTSFRPALLILTSYLIFVLYLGPRWMKSRPAFTLKPALIFYNTAMAIYNGYVWGRMMLNYSELYKSVLDMKFPSLEDNSEWTLTIINFTYLYLISKFVDLLDTVFFVLRKKDSQITGLHLYHHFSVAFHSWILFRSCSTSNCCALFIFMNSGIHLLMYSYYALAAMGPTLRPYLWWKRYITQIQISQFILLFVHSIYFIITQEGYSLYYTFNYIFNSVVYFVLFTQFYKQTYPMKTVVQNGNGTNEKIKSK